MENNTQTTAATAATAATTAEKVTVNYQHRVIEEHNGGDYYGKDIIVKVGTVLEQTKTPGKFRYYGITLGHGVGVDIPANKIGIFKITKITKITQTEELVN